MRQCTTKKTLKGYTLGPVQTERFEAKNKSEDETGRPAGLVLGFRFWLIISVFNQRLKGKT